MDFTLDSEQTALRDAVRGLLEGRTTPSTAARSANEDPGFDEKMWGRLAEMGAARPALRRGRRRHGRRPGRGRRRGRGDRPGRSRPSRSSSRSCWPVAWSPPLGTRRAEEGGARRALRGRAGARRRARSSPTAAGDLAAGGGHRVRRRTLTGVKEPVLGRRPRRPARGHGAPSATGSAVPRRARRRGRASSSYTTLDGGPRRARHLRRRRRRPGSATARPTTGPRSSACIAAAKIAYCHEALGAMDTALRLTTEYLTTRKQFGVTLNRFQALTFRAADMYTSLELTRSIVTWATMVLADQASSPEQVAEAARRAKLQVSTAGRHIGQEAIQLHGGIGMTAEYTVGHLTARLTAHRPPARRRPRADHPPRPAPRRLRGRRAAAVAGSVSQAEDPDSPFAQIASRARRRVLDLRKPPGGHQSSNQKPRPP